jgi:hypothetical protein
LVCQQTSDEVPLIPFQYRGADRFICPQHLPVLIHDPAKLTGLLPGAEGLSPAQHDE